MLLDERPLMRPLLAAVGEVAAAQGCHRVVEGAEERGLRAVERRLNKVLGQWREARVEPVGVPHMTRSRQSINYLVLFYVLSYFKSSVITIPGWTA